MLFVHSDKKHLFVSPIPVPVPIWNNEASDDEVDWNEDYSGKQSDLGSMDRKFREDRVF